MITLEISSTEIRLIETEGGKVTKWASRSLEPGMFEEEAVSDSQALSAAVKQLMTSSDIKGVNVTASVSGLYSISRIVTVPNPLGEPVTRRAVIEAANAVMPLSEDELYLSWQALGTVEGNQHVLVVGVPRDVVDSEVQALRVAGINPRVLDLKAMALARAVNREQALILNIEPSSFDMVVVVKGVIEVMRTIAWQQDDLTVEEKAEHLAVAMELAVGFYNLHHPGLPLGPATPFFITGQMSGDLALVEQLQGGLGYSVEPLAPPLEYPAHMPVSQYAVNIGLALKGTVSAKSLEPGDSRLPDINLLPEVYQPWKPSAKQIYFLLAVVAAIALLFPLYQVTSEAMGETANLRARYTILNSELERRQAELAKREPLQKTISQYGTIVNMGGGFSQDLEVITSRAGELGVEVQSITHEGKAIKITCETDNYITFRKYVSVLEESGRFSSVTRPPEEYSFVTGGIIELKPKPGK